MADVQILDTPEKKQAFQDMLSTVLGSASINFLIGSGASHPAIEPAGKIETEIEELIKSGQTELADIKTYRFLESLQKLSNRILKPNKSDFRLQRSLHNYCRFLYNINKILFERKTSLLPKQANLFTTNYDLLMEASVSSFNGGATFILNDGFKRTPNPHGKFKFNAQNFFDSTFNSGNIYNYKVEIPSINLIKLHGSLSWQRTEDKKDIQYHVSERNEFPDSPDATVLKEIIDEYVIVLPQRTKYGETLINQVYYDLLRIYSNALDKENSLLIVFGFSFEDKHIRDITCRVLKNPSLKVIIFAFKNDEISSFREKFDSFNNVHIVAPASGKRLDFKSFNILLNVTPR